MKFFSKLVVIALVVQFVAGACQQRASGRNDLQVIAVSSLVGVRPGSVAARLTKYPIATPEGEYFFTDFNRFGGKIDNAGQTTFVSIGLLDGESFDSSSTAIWTGNEQAGLHQIAELGDPAPGTIEGSVFDNFLSLPTTSENGNTVFVASLEGANVDSTNRNGIWHYNPERGLSLLARQGDAILGEDKSTRIHEFFSNPISNAIGQTLVRASFRNPEDARAGGSGLFLAEPGKQLELIVRDGDPAPDFLEPIQFGTIMHSNFNDQGRTAFYSTTSKVTAGSSSPSAIWVKDLGLEPRMLAHEGGPASGTTANFQSLGSGQVLSLNNNDQVAFLGRLAGDDIDATNDTGIWFGDREENVRLIAREGDLLPDSTNAATITNLERVTINDLGETVFWVAITETVDDSPIGSPALLKAGEDRALEVIVKVGDQAPGMASGISFSFIDAAAFEVNNRGQVAFWGVHSGSSSRQGIWAEDQAGNLQLIIAAGELVDVSDDPMNPDLRTIDRVNFNAPGLFEVRGGPPNERFGPGPAFNDRGQLTFRAEFTDGSSAILVSNRVAVPVPGSFVLMVIAVATFACNYQSRSLRA